MRSVCLLKSTHRGFRGPNNFLLARRTFLRRNRPSFFRRRFDRCQRLDRSWCSKTIENYTTLPCVCNFAIFFGYDAATNSHRSRARPVRSRFLSSSSLLSFLCLPLFLPPSFTTFRKDKIKCAPTTRENIVLNEYYYQASQPSLAQPSPSPFGKFLGPLPSIENDRTNHSVCYMFAY